MPTIALTARSFAATPAHRVEVSVEALLLAASLYWLLVSNRIFLGSALQGRDALDPSAWGFGFALAVAVTALHVLMLAPLANRWTVKPLLAVMFVVTALATHYMEQFGVFLDPSMLRNVMRTDVREARELFSVSLLWHLLLYAGLPLLLLSRVQVRRCGIWRAGWVRLAFMASALLVLAAALLSVYQPLSSLMRQQKALRYLVTPANVLWSASTVLSADAKGAAQPRRAIGLDAAPGPSWAAGAKPSRPSLLVLVVGETARAANWGLSGYVRQTTPRLAGLPVVNFADVTSCGTNTETSVPCLFAPVGRRQYNEDNIRGSEGLLHVLARAGVAVQWRDNQSGCKGACDGLPTETVSALATAAPACKGGHCLDEDLLQGLDERLKTVSGRQVLVLHMLGNHGPSYFRRYPPAFAKFQPACEKDDLRQCSREQIVNAYDNALLYTDDVLARLVETLRAAAATRDVDTAMLYVSDHGESLGENNLYLHGLPYAVAPRVQTQVPMVMWASEAWPASSGLDLGCLKRRAAQPAAHDHVFHTVLGLMDVRTALYEPAFDVTADCRKPG